MKKIILICCLIFVVISIIPIIFLTRNIIAKEKPNFGSTPEETATLHVKNMTQAGFLIDTNTVEAIQKVAINDLHLVLVQYNASRIEGGVELCEMVVEVEKTFPNQWNAKGGAGLCQEVNQPTNRVPITVVSNYGTSTLLDRGYSTAFGYLRDGQITEVMITWEDGLVQPASIADRTYMAAREGSYHLEEIEVFNNLGEIIFSNQITPAQGGSN